MATVKVALGFARLSDGDLDGFADTVWKGLTDYAGDYPTPPVTLVNLLAQLNDFRDKIAAAAVGGKADTAAKDASRQTLLGMLQQLALYVEMMANGDREMLLRSGFQARSTERQRLPLEKPTGVTITNDGEGVLNVQVDPVKNCSMYEGRAKVDDDASEWMPSVFTGDSRKIRFEGLTPGAMYTIQIRALGGSTGMSDWSDPSQHRSL